MFSINVEHKSAITDHANRNKCMIYGVGEKVVDRETNRCVRWIKEGIWIRITVSTENMDGGLHTKSLMGQPTRHAI